MSYYNARCAAITKAGRRCRGRWSTAIPVTFAWDPIAGVGLDGPYCVLCHRHRHWASWGPGVDKAKRCRVMHGWLGRIPPHHFYFTVFASRTSPKPAAWWWKMRLATKFGQPHRSDAA